MRIVSVSELVCSSGASNLKKNWKNKKMRGPGTSY